MPNKYDDARTLAMAKAEVHRVTSLQELSDALGMPRSSLKGLLRRNGYKSWRDLLVEASGDAMQGAGTLKRQNDHLRKVVKRLESTLSDRDWLRQELAGQIAVSDSVTVQPPKYKGGEKQEQVAVLELSDVHYGMSVTGGQLGPLFGGYNTDIASARVIHTFRTFARLAHQQSFPVKKAVVYLLGDMIEHSFMRASQAKYTSVHVVKQSIDMANILIGGLRMLASQFEEVEVHFVPGNHGRATQKAGDNLPDETFEHLMFYIVQTALANQPNLTLNSYDAWYFIDDILGFKFLCLHGEDVRSWAGIPFYGISRLVKDYFMLSGLSTKQRLRQLHVNDTMTVADFLGMLNMPDYVCLGHFHTPMLWHMIGVEVLANGTTSGASFFSAKRLHTYSTPIQNMFFVHPEHGVGIRIPIDLQDVGGGS